MHQFLGLLNFVAFLQGGRCVLDAYIRQPWLELQYFSDVSRHVICQSSLGELPPTGWLKTRSRPFSTFKRHS